MFYTIERIKGVFKITNLTGYLMSVRVFKQESCLDNTFVECGVYLDFLDTKEIKILTGDGAYKFVISYTEVIESVPTIVVKEHNFLYFDNLLYSLINDIDNILCNCECVSCDDCYNTDKEVSDTLLKLISYFTVTNKYYNGYFQAAYNCLECSIIDANQCLLINEKVIGKTENILLLKKIVALYYLTFYFAEYAQAVTDEEKKYIDLKFKFLKIKKCIANLGINIQCIIDNITNMALFTVNSSLYNNQAPSQVGNYSLNVNNRSVTILTAAMFTTATTPPYADPEGDLAQAIRIDSLPASGTLLYNNIPVTIGQIITVVDIAANLLKYVSPNQNLLASASFNFSVRDTGSMLFTS